MTIIENGSKKSPIYENCDFLSVVNKLSKVISLQIVLYVKAIYNIIP